jgi:hypothetical protein
LFRFSGQFRDTVSAIFYAFVIASFLIMQAYAEWQKYQLKKIEIISPQSKSLNGIVKKTGKESSSVTAWSDNFGPDQK